MYSDVPTREKLDLSGSWEYTLDGKSWNTVSVPSAYDFTGKVTFQRSFDVKPEQLDKYAFSLVAYGINYQCEIFINGNFIGRHMGGYSSFVLAIPPNTLQVGKDNSIRVSVDNELTPATTLPLRQPVGGWRTYGGILRDLYILGAPRLSIDDVSVTYPPSEANRNRKVSVQAEISDRGSNTVLAPGQYLGMQVEVYDKLTGEMTGRSGINTFASPANKSLTVNADVVLPSPKTWSPESPDLYVFKCEIVRLANKEVSVLDEFDIDVGLRDLKWVGGRLFVNESLVSLKGVLWQEDHASFGGAMTYESLERDIALVKALGANLIRFPYPPHPYMLNLCDRYGLLAMEEIPLGGVPSGILAKDYYEDLAATYIREMVWRDKRHSSVLAWGIGDGFETPASGACDYVNGMRNIIKAIDSRLVYFANQPSQSPCWESVDMMVVNHTDGDVKDFREELKDWKSKNPEKPIIVTQYSRDIEPGNHNGYSDPLSMESQARLVVQCFEAVGATKIAGGVFASFNDWRSDRPALSTHSHDPYLHSMGLVAYDREKRTSFDIARTVFNGEKVQALPVGNFSSSAPIIYVLAGIFALISFFFLYNSNRHFRESVNRSIFRTYNFFADVRDERILSYGHTIFLAVIVSVTWATILSSLCSHYRDNVVFDNVLSQFLSDGPKEWLVRLVWSPVKFIMVASGGIFFGLCSLSLLVRILSITARARVYFYHCFSITMWSMLPFVIFIPVAMVLYRLSMETDTYLMPVGVLVGLVSLWVFMRLLKGISIVYDVFPLKVYATGLLLVIVATAALYSYIDYSQSTSLYLKHVVQSMKHSA